MSPRRWKWCRDKWKVAQCIREKFTCRDCEKVTQVPALFHALPRGFAGPSVFAMILFEKYGQHQPLNGQSERYACEGIELSLSTLADQVGGCAALLRPLYDPIRAHVLAVRVHGEATPVPVLAEGQTAAGRVWVSVRDHRPFGGRYPPAAVLFYSRDRAAEHAEHHLHGYGSILPADCRAGFNRLHEAGCNGDPITEATCCAHARRKFFVLADVTTNSRANSPSSRQWRSRRSSASMRTSISNARSRPAVARTARRARVACCALVVDLENCMRTERAKLSRHSEVAKAMDYMLKR